MRRGSAEYSILFDCRPLHIAAKQGLVPVAQDLIAKGASLIAQDSKGGYTSNSLTASMINRHG